MAATHLAIYDNSTGYVHAVHDLTVTGAWSNEGTYLADDYVDMATAGHVLEQLGTNCRAIKLTNPTFDQSDYAEFGALEVDVPGAPTDTQERTDGGKLGTGGGDDGDTPEYTF